jgi:hypothetical protein
LQAQQQAGNQQAKTRNKKGKAKSMGQRAWGREHVTRISQPASRNNLTFSTFSQPLAASSSSGFDNN